MYLILSINMKIAAYQNISDREIKKICEIADLLQSSFMDIDLISLRKCDNALNRLKEYETLIFFTHGSPTTLYHSFNDQIALINSEDDTIKILNNKKVIAISCSTASVLGKKACEEECIVYLGMNKRLHFDILQDGENIEGTKNYQDFLKNIYYNAFSTALIIGFNNNVSFEKLKNIMKIELDKEVYKQNETIKQKNQRNYQLNKFQFSLNAVLHVSENIVVHGDSSQQLK